MNKVDYDKIDDLRDQMLDMKFEANYMNEMLNRNYDVDLDENDLDEDFEEFEREIAKEKKQMQNKQNIQQNNININNKMPANVNVNNVNTQQNSKNVGLYHDNFDINRF